MAFHKSACAGGQIRSPKSKHGVLCIWASCSPSGSCVPTNFSITAARAKVMAETETETGPGSNNNCQLANDTFCA